MAQIGIKLADGSFYAVLDGDQPQRKRMSLTVARDGQTSAQIDVLRMDGDEHQFVGCLVLEEIAGDPDSELELVIGLDAEGRVDARVSDADDQQYQSLSVDLSTIGTEESFSLPELDDDSGDIGAVDSLEDIDLPDGLDDALDDDLSAVSLEDAFEAAPDTEPSLGSYELQESFDEPLDEDESEEIPPRPYSPLTVAALVLFGLSVIALAAFGVFRWLQTDPIPELRAAMWGMPLCLPRRWRIARLS